MIVCVLLCVCVIVCVVVCLCDCVCCARAFESRPGVNHIRAVASRERGEREDEENECDCVCCCARVSFCGDCGVRRERGRVEGKNRAVISCLISFYFLGQRDHQPQAHACVAAMVQGTTWRVRVCGVCDLRFACAGLSLCRCVGMSNFCVLTDSERQGAKGKSNEETNASGEKQMLTWRFFCLATKEPVAASFLLCCLLFGAVWF